MGRSLRWTSADLDVMPDDGKRYEIIDGELYVSKQPDWYHQATCGRFFAALDRWNSSVGSGSVSLAPGVLFAEDDDVAPDVVWASAGRVEQGLDSRGHLHVAPELVVEVLSPGATNERRESEAKLKLYSRRGVDEYWIANWRTRTVEVYRRVGEDLDLVATLRENDVLESPLLPGFSVVLAEVFAGLA
jgi:Uma2 family endonuclease